MNSISLTKEKQSAVTKVNKTAKRNKSSSKDRKNQNDTNKERKRRSSKTASSTGVIYIGHIPHGFYEDEMKAYFNQFGIVLATTVARSKKTGRSKGYGYVEFKDQEVAKIAAETMNNYLMFNRIIKCKYIPPEERKRTMFSQRISMTNYPKKKNRLITLKNNKQAFMKMNQATYLKKVQKKVNEFKKFFEEKGIDFTFTINNENSEPDEDKSKESLNSVEPKLENGTENEIGVLEIDESDSEISFKTPPKVKKVIKKTSNHPVTISKKDKLSKKSLAKKEVKMTQLKNKRAINTQENGKLKKKSELGLKGSEKKLEKKAKAKLPQPVKTKPKIIPKTGVKENSKQKNLKLKKSSEVKEKLKKKEKAAKNKSTRIGANKVTKTS